MITSMAELAPTLSPVAEPKFTWYGSDGDRVDLSGRVLANWFVKATNFCAQELDLAPGDGVWLDLPAHWRTVVWAVGCWSCGGQVIAADEPGAADAGAQAVVTATADERTAAIGSQVVIALPALALHLEHPPPAGALDGAAELTAQPDELILPADGAGDDIALGSATQEDLLTGAEPGQRVLVTHPTATVLLSLAPAVWSRGGSVVVVADPDADVESIARAEATTSSSGLREHQPGLRLPNQTR